MYVNPNAASQPNGEAIPSRFSLPSTATASSTPGYLFAPAYQAVPQPTAPVSPAALQGQTTYSFNNQSGGAYKSTYNATPQQPAAAAPVIRNFYYTYPSNVASVASPAQERKFHWKKFLFNTVSTIAGTAVVVGGIGLGLSKYLGMSPKEMLHRVRAIGQVCMTVPMPAIDSALAFMKTGDFKHMGDVLAHSTAFAKPSSASGSASGHALDGLVGAIAPGHTVQSLQTLNTGGLKIATKVIDTWEKKEVGKGLEYLADVVNKCQELELGKRLEYISQLVDTLEANDFSASIQYLNDMMKTCQDQNAKEGLANLLKLMQELKNKSALRILSGF